jgi:hypothetical protein
VCVFVCVCFGNMYTVLTEVFINMTEVFPCFFLSCKANAMVKLAKTGHGPHSSTLFVICVVRLLSVLFCALFVCKCVLPPGGNPIAVNKYIIYCIYVSKDVRTRYFSKPKGVREQKRMGKTGIEQSTVDDFFCMSRHSHAIVMETHT